MEKELESKDKELNTKEKEIAALKNELEYLKSQILNKNRKIFGSSSEQSNSMQLSIFDEAEKLSDLKVVEPTIEEITYKRNKPSQTKGKKDNLLNLEREVIEHKLEENEQTCDKYSEDLVVIGTKTKEILKYVPAKLYVQEHITYPVNPLR